MKSIHLFLDALNVIRSFYVAEKARTFPSNTLKVCYYCCFLLKLSISYTITNWKTVKTHWILNCCLPFVDLYQLDLLLMLLLLIPLSQGGLMDHCYSSHETHMSSKSPVHDTWNCDSVCYSVTNFEFWLILFNLYWFYCLLILSARKEHMFPFLH